MLTLSARVKLVLFLVIAVVVIAYTGIRYADLGRFVGMRGTYTVKLDLATTGGLFEGSAVSYRGITVGKVGKLHLTRDGVIADLWIDNSAPKIPRDLKAVVADRSAVGEQYVDLEPNAAAGPYLAAGSTIPRSVTTTPAPVSETLKSVNDLAASLPLNDLKTVIDELGLAFAGQGPHLQQLLDTSGKFLTASDENFPETKGLLDNGSVALRTQNEEAAAFTSFARSSKLLAGQLKMSDADLRRLIAVTPGAADEMSKLLDDIEPGFGPLVANLLTTSRVFDSRQAALEEVFVRLPQVAGMGSTIVSSGTLRLGLVNTFFNPQPCTRGYGGTQYRNGLDTSKGPKWNTAAHCAEPASSGINVRGSANAPRKGVPAAVKPAASTEVSRLLGAFGLPDLTGGQPTDMAGLLGLGGGR